jgi:hypothetical protein
MMMQLCAPLSTISMECRGRDGFASRHVALQQPFIWPVQTVDIS